MRLSDAKIARYDADLIEAAIKAAETGDDQYVKTALETPGYHPHWKVATDALAQAVLRSSYPGDQFLETDKHMIKYWGFNPRFPGLSKNGVLLLLNAGAKADAYETPSIRYVSQYEKPLYVALDLASKMNSNVLQDVRYLQIFLEYGIKPKFLKTYLDRYGAHLPKNVRDMMMGGIENPTATARPSQRPRRQYANLGTIFGLKVPALQLSVTPMALSIGPLFNLSFGRVSVGLVPKDELAKIPAPQQPIPQRPKVPGPHS